MAFRFTIGKKIGAGFGILILCVVGIFYVTDDTLNSSVKRNEAITKINNPSVDALEELKLVIVRSKMLIFNWVYYQSHEDHPDKVKLIRLTEQELPLIKKKINSLASYWSDEDQEKINNVFSDIEALFILHEEVRTLLPDWESYEDSQSKFLANFMVGDDGEIYAQSNDVIYQLDDLINNQKFNSDKLTNAMLMQFNKLQSLFRMLVLGLVIGGILIAIYTTRTIVKPVHQLKLILLTLSKGVFPNNTIRERDDEIGEMTNALNRVVSGLKSTKDFANAVGSGHFETTYEPLSNEDELGHALLKMRDDLAENERELEQKVKERTAEVVRQKEEIEHQNSKISELYREVTDSIKYAKSLQEAILPPEDYVNKALPHSFILYKPKDIVSGDFYWVEEKGNKVYFAAVDCTGHGVPGAFMSIVGYNTLNDALNKQNDPAAILDELNKGISNKLHRNSANSAMRDGMDVAICCVDFEKNELQYAGAYNPLYILRNNEVQQIRADKFPIGSYFDGEPKNYTNHKIQLEKGDYVYIFSDGYADQFGGPKGKKFMYRRFREYLLSLIGKDMTEQKQFLDSNIEKWRGPLEQVDDILVMGLHIPQ